MQITRWADPATLTDKLRFDDAQPRERMTSELMEDVLRGSPWAELTGEPLMVLGCSRFPSLPGDVLTIHDDFEHRYIYRVVGYDWAADTFELQWPD
jgi:hypothetical protein